MAKPVTIGETTYKTTAAATTAVREFMASVELGLPLSGDAAEFAVALLERHPNRDEKVGVGVESIIVRINHIHGSRNRGLWINRIDGSEVDFSWVECLKPTTHRQKVINALRFAIQADMYRFKREAFSGRDLVECYLTGVMVRLGGADVHHDPPFLELAEAFTGGRWDRIEVCVGGAEVQIGDRLVDLNLCDRWIAYHREKARLYITDRDAHRRLKNSIHGGSTPGRRC